jgi:ribosomal protein S18 acetylase RimI-like enzyme
MSNPQAPKIMLKHAETNDEIISCFDVMSELRANLTSPLSFLEQVRRMQQEGYQLLMAIEDGNLIALAGYRGVENFIHGMFIYVDDLITSEKRRGQELGERMLVNIFETAKEDGYSKVVLNTGIGNTFAQGFYYHMGMIAMGMHFSYELEA